jgi:hypothetical protein
MMTIEGRPVLSDKTYKKYVLEHLENWVHDAITTDDVTAQEVYDVLIKAIGENVDYHRKELDKNTELLSLLKGHRPSVFDASAHEFENFWYDSESSPEYTEEVLDAMCDAAADKEKCREYNLREAEYYTKRAELDAEHERQQQCSCDY